SSRHLRISATISSSGIACSFAPHSGPLPAGEREKWWARRAYASTLALRTLRSRYALYARVTQSMLVLRTLRSRLLLIPPQFRQHRVILQRRRVLRDLRFAAGNIPQ